MYPGCIAKSLKTLSSTFDVLESKVTTLIQKLARHDLEFVDDGNVESPRRNEDMDNVIRELTLAVMKSKNVSTLTRAFKSAQKVQPADENLFSETGLIFVKEKL